jgi:glycosyltransferase involved in cell wall biosynthesis
MTREKEIIDFIHAIPRATDQVSDLKFSIVGSGPVSNWVNEQCTRLRTERGIDITRTGWVKTDLVDYYNELKLFVLPTYLNAFPISILEAMACGTPAIAYDILGYRDAIRDGETGVLTEATPEAMARAAIHFARETELQRRLSEGALSWSSQFSWDETAAAFLNEIEAVVGRDGDALRFAGCLFRFSSSRLIC